jgi:hypothetical protein
VRGGAGPERDACWVIAESPSVEAEASIPRRLGRSPRPRISDRGPVGPDDKLDRESVRCPDSSLESNTKLRVGRSAAFSGCGHREAGQSRIDVDLLEPLRDGSGTDAIGRLTLSNFAPVRGTRVYRYGSRARRRRETM